MNGLSLFYDRNTVYHFVFPTLALTVPVTSHAGIFLDFSNSLLPGAESSEDISSYPKWEYRVNRTKTFQNFPRIPFPEESNKRLCKYNGAVKIPTEHSVHAK